MGKKVRNYRDAEKQYFAAEKAFKRQMKELGRLKDDSADLIAESMDVLRSIKRFPAGYEELLDEIHTQRMRYVESQIGRRNEMADAILSRTADIAGNITGKIAERLPVELVKNKTGMFASKIKKSAEKKGLVRKAPERSKSDIALVVSETEKIRKTTESLNRQYAEIRKQNLQLEKMLRKQEKLINTKYPKFPGLKKKKIDMLLALTRSLSEKLC